MRLGGSRVPAHATASYHTTYHHSSTHSIKHESTTTPTVNRPLHSSKTAAYNKTSQNTKQYTRSGFVPTRGNSKRSWHPGLRGVAVPQRQKQRGNVVSTTQETKGATHQGAGQCAASSHQCYERGREGKCPRTRQSLRAAQTGSARRRAVSRTCRAPQSGSCPTSGAPSTRASSSSRHARSCMGHSSTWHKRHKGAHTLAHTSK